MENQNKQTTNAQTLITIYVIWGVYLFTHLTFLASMYFILKPANDVAISIITIIICSILSLALATISLLFHYKARIETNFKRFNVYFLISISLIEMIHFIGLIGTYMGLRFKAYLAFFTLSILLHVFYYPRLRKFIS